MRERASDRRIGFIRRFFWLQERFYDIAYAGRSPAESGWLEFDAARESHDALLRLDDLSPSNVAVLTLRRLEALQLTRAIMKRHGFDSSNGGLTAQDWVHAESIDEIRGLRSSLSDGQRVVFDASLSEGGESYLIRLDRAGRRLAAGALGRSAQELIGSFRGDEEKIERLRLLRRLRIGSAILALIAFSLLGARGLEAHRQKNNLAFHRPVRVSSTMDVQYSSPERLVDGNIANVGFHTTHDDPMPWAMIDLGESKHIRRVVIYNRADCCQERSVPMALEVSEDGVHFEKIAERLVKFDKWTVKDLNATGRYVRVRLEGIGFFHLAEVGVYE